ncbi:ABC transporter permease [Rhizohabitans arisaemae]|uniref:ABC transporter permease n=1 Tax=Rhizohabitans arisaemae TaxID=2720610 RepID=UPI0024B1B1CD|nr:ABC transporter permease [Rhizohabitans arisaemae]
MTGVLSSEWLKLRSLRSTYYAIGAAALMTVLGAGWVHYVGTIWDGRAPETRAAFQAAAPTEGFLPLVQLSLAVLGVLAITSEYATSMIRASLAAVPGRERFLLAKVAVVTAVTLVAAYAILLATYAAGRIIAGDRPMGFNTGSLADDLPMLLASGLSATVLALIGLGLGTATRSTAGGIGSVVAVLFVLPGIANYLPSPWNTRVSSLLPSSLVSEIADRRLSSRLGDGVLPPTAALAVLLGYAVVAVTVAVIAIRRRDA